jgi:hypothetical protein
MIAALRLLMLIVSFGFAGATATPADRQAAPYYVRRRTRRAVMPRGRIHAPTRPDFRPLFAASSSVENERRANKRGVERHSGVPFRRPPGSVPTSVAPLPTPRLGSSSGFATGGARRSRRPSRLGERSSRSQPYREAYEPTRWGSKATLRASHGPSRRLPWGNPVFIGYPKQTGRSGPHGAFPTSFMRYPILHRVSTATLKGLLGVL